ncbi:hypothetical protein OG230_22110 [Streptomyces sp. NBC_00234]|uniref:hypothetical protein n=1 Tax=Streptomyces sp. NBC_00234 TaxID=2903638 RepID=UPI002E2E4889|nr:hypothetical protein [Streptomyces sp. NBC_00234]
MRNESQRQPKAPETPELAALLAAARRTAAPDADDELRATAAFLAARDQGAHAARSPWWRRRDDWRPAPRWRGARSVRVMLGGFVAAATLGGVAVAAGSGALPTPFGDGGKDAPDSVRPTHGTLATPGGPRSGGTPSPTGDGTPGAATNPPDLPRPSGGPDRGRSDVALCRVYAKDREHGKAADATTLARLEAAAGEASEAAVKAYCDDLLGSPAPGSKGASGALDGSGKAEKGEPVPPKGTGDGGPSGAASGSRNGRSAG